MGLAKDYHSGNKYENPRVNDGIFAFRHLPPQSLANPYLVLCFDDRPTGFLNAMVYDRVYQVDDNGNPPQN